MKSPLSRFWFSAAVLLVALQFESAVLRAQSEDVYGGTLILNGSYTGSGSTATIAYPGGTLILNPSLHLNLNPGIVQTAPIITSPDYGTLTLTTSSSQIDTSQGTLPIGGYMVTSTGTILLGSNTPIAFTGLSTLTLNGLTNTLAVNNTNLGSGTLNLTSGTLSLVRAGENVPIRINATVGATLNSLPNVISSVTGASARILQGTLSVDNTISFLYLPTVANMVGTPLNLHFTEGVSDKFVLQLSYNPLDAAALGNESDLYLGWFDPVANVWKKANAANSDGGVASHFVQGAYDAATDFELGTYGVDTESNTVWAVIDHNSTFGVLNNEVQAGAPTPEPSALILTLLGGSAMLLRRRRRAV